MKIAFLTDPLSHFKTYKDSTYAMMVEADKRGYAIYAFGPEDMALESGKVIAGCRSLNLCR
jgi:glutathione synthase